MLTAALITLLCAKVQSETPLLNPTLPMVLRGTSKQLSGQVTPTSATFNVLEKGETAYSCEVQTTPTVVAVKQNDTLYFTFEARCLKAKNESQTASWTLRVQRPAAPWDGPYSASHQVGKEWRRFHGAFRADKDYAAGQLLITLHVAGAIQSVELKGLKWANYGPNVKPETFPTNQLSYGGQAADAPWRAKAEAMIEKYRKANFVIQTKPGASVYVRMLRHAYPFATVTGVDPTRTDPDALRFFTFMKSNYSRVTTPIYWSDWGWESAESRKKYITNLDWCVANGYRMKGHNLIWPSYKWSPERLKPLNATDLKTEITKALDSRIVALKKYPFETIDVVNELVSEHDFEDKIGLGFAVEAFKKAHAAWPKADLVYNDYLVEDGDGVNPKYLGYAKKLKAAGAPLSLLGYQAHFGEALPSIPWMWTLLDTAKKETGLPVEITEFDLNTQNNKVQAEYTRDIVTAWFAHPQSKGFTMWGFWQGDHWIPSSAMVRQDWTLRPSAQAWIDLVTKKWWTTVSVKADAKGIARVRGFMGDYEVMSGGKTQRVKLGASGQTVKF